ncbi:MAG: UDP-N-acetylglucosamine 1-carboxyvinyltransferase [Alphaproteobacteria bacterium MarineAlpha6_Bin1]|nr:MAG: UDP-N-acetylglucosamine 1-carboxyvinyltransferase [Alphaproteobacteria bacterium MarineAlpha6_Bin1]
MEKISISGGKPLFGKIRVSGSKNSSLPILSCCLLTDKKLTIKGVPKLTDTFFFLELLSSLGVNISNINKSSRSQKLILQARNITKNKAPYDLVKKMRASILVLGPLLARTGKAIVSLPGGCAIGTRPVDIHLKSLEKLGAIISIEDGYIFAKAPKGLRGNKIIFPKISVGATTNILMASVLANGTTEIVNSAKEPEIIDLGNCLKSMGAKIHGLGTNRIVVQGVSSLKESSYQVMYDRIEIGTYALATAITGGEIELLGAKKDFLNSFLNILEIIGVKYFITDESIIFKKNSNTLYPIDVTTEPYPGFPTDLQAQLMAVMSTSNGTSFITENIFENRFMHVPELIRMGAKIKLKGNLAIIEGINKLKGAEVMATDLRASVSLVLAGLVAEGETNIGRVYHIDRGYQNIVENLRECGAMIKRIKV